MKEMNNGGTETAFPVNEIFASINGEGTLSGELAVFIRLCNCNLRCSYCDTKYAWDSSERKLMTIPEITAKVKSFGNIRNVTVTGGEPLFRKNLGELLRELTGNGHIVNIETNGSLSIRPYAEAPYASKLIFCCDYKLPSSGEERKMHLANISDLRENDVLKFVIGSEEDFAKVLSLLREYRPKCFVYLSAVFGMVEPKEIVEKLLSWADIINTDKIRVQLQLHKYIWDPTLRGV